MHDNNQIICPICEELNSSSSKFCIYCNEPLIKEDDSQVTIQQAAKPYPPKTFSSLKIEEGIILNERFLIKSKIGTGGFGTVYHAHDKILDEVVALKILHPQYNIDSEVQERFLKEIKLARKITHPNVVRIYDIIDIQNTSVISMEFFESKNLKEIIQKEGIINFKRAVGIIKQICQALDSAHELNIIHRDIKPHNILVNKEDFIKIVDFGIAKNIYLTSEDDVTKTGTIIGTPDYMSPEQANGDEFDHRSDIYSLGIVIYEMLSDSVPFKSGSPLNTLIQQIQKKHEPIILINPNIPVWFSDILDKILEKKPVNRYQNGKEIIDDIDTSLKREKIKEQAKIKAIEYLNQNMFDQALSSIQQAKNIDPNDNEIQSLILKISKRKREVDFEISQPIILKQQKKFRKKKTGAITSKKISFFLVCVIVAFFISVTSYKYFRMSAVDSISASKIETLYEKGNIYLDNCMTQKARIHYLDALKKDPLFTPAFIKLVITFFLDFAMSSFIFARFTFMFLFLLMSFAIAKTIFKPNNIILLSISLAFIILNILFIIVFFKISTALNSGTYNLDVEKNTQQKGEILPQINLDIAKIAYKENKFLDAFVELENYLLMEPLGFTGYFYYYSTYWEDFIRKSEIGLPFLSIFQFCLLLTFFLSGILLINKL
ncbi:serine/threonine protein kinase [bacterium]|nr:serine/threonine protein kinase [bacterium]